MVLDLATVGLLLTLMGCIASFLAYNLAKKKEDKQEIKEDSSVQTSLKMQLEYISRGVDDIKSEMRDIKNDAKLQDKTITEIITQLTRVEESAKSLWKRFEELEKRINDLDKERI